MEEIKEKQRTWLDVVKQERFETERILTDLRMIILHKWKNEGTLHWLGHQFKIKYEGEVQKDGTVK